MKESYIPRAAIAAVLLAMTALNVNAGLTLEIHLYRNSQGNNYSFYTPLYTNALAPTAALGTYIVSSPHQPTNGSVRGFELTASGLNDLYYLDSEHFYSDFNSAIYQITNGPWSILFTNGTTTNVYRFTVSASGITSNSLPATTILFPAQGESILTTDTNFTWQSPAGWTVGAFAQTYDGLGFYNSANVPAGQSNWNPSAALLAGTNLTFTLQYIETNSVFLASTPLNTNNSQPISGWTNTSLVESGTAVNYEIVGSRGTPSSGHTCLAYYSFEDNNLFAHDFSGNNNNIDSYGWFGTPPYLVTNDAESGLYSCGFTGSGWLSPRTNLSAFFAGSFSISLWLKTTNLLGTGTDRYSVAGLVSDDAVVAMGMAGGKLALVTGGMQQNTLLSQASVNTGQYVHVVTTRDQQTGEKRIYINGTLDSTNYSDTDLLFPADPGSFDIGANNGQGFIGEMDEIQLYSGVLSPSDVAFLHTNPGSKVADALELGVPVARYDFEQTNAPGTDSSGRNNDATCSSGGSPVDVPSTDAAVGNFARQYFGQSSICFGAFDQAYPALSNALSGSFAITAWVKTTNSVNADFANAYFGSPIWFEYTGPGINQVVVSITGSKAAFTVGNPNGGSDTTLHSVTSVNDGNYHFLAATRDENSGVMNLYVDGSLEATDVSTNGPRPMTSTMYLAGGYVTSFQGLLDDVRIYGAALSADDVGTLAGHPSFNTVLGTSGLAWVTSGDTSWFAEATNTYPGSASAARSGSVTNSQSSTLSVTVTGPGTLSFAWSSFAEDPNGGLDYQFAIDGNGMADLYGDNSWQQSGPFSIAGGEHTLSWTVYANGDTDPTQAGYLDQVSFVSVLYPPVITLQPFDQTNYPGYTVALAADSTNTPAPTWQWYKVGVGAIANATSKSYLPTNSGTVAVAGSYYAIATGLGGSTTTRTAVVSFVNAPLPPDWSFASKSPFQAVDSGYLTEDFYAGLAVDGAGNVYAAAQYIGNQSVIVSNTAQATFTAVGTNGAAALIKHASDGHALWGVGFTNSQPSSSSYGIGVAVAPANGAYLASILTGTNWLGTNVFTNSGGSSILISRFDANGSNIWSRSIGKTNYTFNLYNTLVSDAAGNVTVGGLMAGTVDFGGTNVTIPSGQSGFIAQYDSSGNPRWVQTLPGFPVNLCYSSGRIYVSILSVVSGGVTNISIGSISNVTDRMAGVAALNATNGQALWLRGVADQYGANTHGLIDDVPLLSVSGTNLFITGTAYGSQATFGNLTVPISGGRGQYFARYDTNGNPQMALGFGSPTTTTWASAADSQGNVYVSGDFDTYSQFGTDVLGAPVYAQNDLGPNFYTQAFLAKFDQNGNGLWAREATSSDEVNFRGIALASDGVWACGFVKITNSVLAQFGTHQVYSDLQIVGFPFGTIYYHQGGVLGKVTESVAAASAVTMRNPQDNGSTFQFQFQSQSGFSHAVQYRTNLASGLNWQTYSNVTGDGSLKTIPVPLSVFNPSKQGFIRVLTQ